MHAFYSQFDINFLSRALTLHRSLQEYCTEPFVHYLLCLDDSAYELLQKMALPNAVLLRLSAIETNELREARKTRTLFEYYWTVGPSGLAYVFDTYKPVVLAYLDGDMCFYSSPKVLFEELGNDSVLLFPHNTGVGAKVEESKVGKYNVGGLLFRNDTNGRAALLWWAERCIEWCFDRIEDGKYGDQKYLDEFETRFSGVRISRNLGADVALWNIHNYKVTEREGKVYVGEDKLVFYHFAKLKYYYPLSNVLPRGPLSAYTLPSKEKGLIYAPYFRRLYAAVKELENLQKIFPFGSAPRPSHYKQLRNAIGGWFILRKAS